MTHRYRPIAQGEQEVVGRVFAAGLNDLMVQVGAPPHVDLDDAVAWTRAWETDRRSLFEHLATHDSHGWLAEEEGRILGYARSILREGICQLSEYFVLPGEQQRGIGKGLLERAFLAPVAEARSVIATTRPAAMARYLKAGVYPICPVCDLERRPEPVAFDSDLEFQPLTGTAQELEALDALDQVLVGYRRRVDHRWLITERAGFLYRRQGQPVGYGYLGNWSGPFALLEPGDFPAVLSHAETIAAETVESFVVMVPMTNRVALDHLLARGFKFDDGFMMLYMADHARLQLDRYLFTMPGFFI